MAHGSAAEVQCHLYIALDQNYISRKEFEELYEKIKDITAKGERERVQVFQGIVMGLRGAGISKTVTIRKDAKGWMVEKIFPLAQRKLASLKGRILILPFLLPAYLFAPDLIFSFLGQRR